MSELAIRTSELSKRYRGGVLAVDGINLTVARGEIYAFLGLNGAGKSTTIRMLLGMIRPTTGQVELFGQRVHAGASKLWRRVGHLVESASAYPELTVRENLEVARRLAGVEDAQRGARDDRPVGPRAVRRPAGRDALAWQPPAARVARALLHRPELVLLDEPANGLDPAGVVEIRELLRGLAREGGATVFMSSHILGEVDLLATRVGIVHRGRLIEELDSASLERHRDRRLEVGARDLGAAEGVLRAAGLSPAHRAPNPDAELLELREPRALEAPEDIARVLVAAGVPPTHLALARESLEDHFIRRTGEIDEGQDERLPLSARNGVPQGAPISRAVGYRGWVLARAHRGRPIRGHL